MGVNGLWRLLLPIGRRISVETLEGRTLAIDASIWLTQFLKANRDPDTGAVRPGAHLIGFLRRICKLLYHGIRPVFVFDGATPEIKLREIRARRERRERMNIGVGAGGEDDGAIKRMARKILVANLKRAKELDVASKKQKTADAAAATSSAGAVTSSGAFSSSFNLGDDDEDENDNKNDQDSERNGFTGNGEASTDNMIDLSELDDGAEYSRSHGEDHNKHPEKHLQNDWDDAKPVVLFGSDDSSSSGGSSASVQIPDDEDQLDIDAVLSLPASQRKDVIEKAKRKQRMRSRKEFMPAAANPEAYSQVQLRNFLRSSNLNKKINEMGAKAAKGEGFDGLEGEAIASDATRRFIFVKDKVKDEEKKDGSSDPRTSLSAVVSGFKEQSPGRRNRLRRVAGDTNESDDDDVFGGKQFNSEEAHGASSAANKHRAIYSSSEDEDGGGGFVVDVDAGHAGEISDPKRKNYMSHTHHDAKGWTLDETNVFDTRKDGGDDSSSDEGGGFIANETSALSISRHQQSKSSSTQLHEDEMLARALQEAEDEDAARLGESNAGGYHAEGVHISDLSRKQETSDAILAAKLQAEEQNKGDRLGGTCTSSTNDLSGDAEKRKIVVLGGSSESVNVTNSDIAEVRPRGKRQRGGVPQKVPQRNDTPPAQDSDDDVEWEDGDDRADVQGETGKESDDDVDWEDGAAHGEKGNEKESPALHEHSVEVSVYVQSRPDERSSDHGAAWDDGMADLGPDANDNDNEISRHNSRRNSLSETDGELEADATNDFVVSAVEDANIAALRHAEETAANLTNWAGRAVRRAIAAHIEESGAAGTSSAAVALMPARIPPLAAGHEVLIDDSSAAHAGRGIEDDAKRDDDSSKVVIEVESHHGEGSGSKEAVKGEAMRVSESHSPAQSADNSSSSSQLLVTQPSAVPTPISIGSSINVHSMVDTSLEALQQEDSKMRDELNKQQRDMDTVTDEMKEEIMQLLQLFGIPYIEAPAEAEAQACTLEALGLVDGVVVSNNTVRALVVPRFRTGSFSQYILSHFVPIKICTSIFNRRKIAMRLSLGGRRFIRISLTIKSTSRLTLQAMPKEISACIITIWLPWQCFLVGIIPKVSRALVLSMGWRFYKRLTCHQMSKPDSPSFVSGSMALNQLTTLQLVLRRKKNFTTNIDLQGIDGPHRRTFQVFRCLLRIRNLSSTNLMPSSLGEYRIWTLYAFFVFER